MTSWYPADTHFGHENVMRFFNYPFASASPMDAVMLGKMCEMVGSEDQLWILGDKDPENQSSCPHRLSR